MKKKIETLGDTLPNEIARCQKLLVGYAARGPGEQWGALLIKHHMAAGLRAMSEGNVGATLQAYEALRKCE